jgi:hypothetical protein
MELLVMGKVHGIEDINRMFSNCPTVLRNELLRWLLFENEKFIGTKKINGAIRNSLERKRTWIGNSAWKKQVVTLFKGYVVDPITNQQVTFKKLNAGTFGAGTGVLGTGVSMRLKMGMMYRNKRQIHEALESLDESHSVNSSKYMPVPVKGLNISKPYTKFSYWLKQGMFNVVYKNGLALYFLKGKKGSSESSNGPLMFVGRKNVNVKWRLGFNMAWANRQSGVIPRGEAAINKAVQKIKGL